MINLIIWLVAGAAIGWIASMLMRTNAQQGTILNIVVGVIGALIGGFVFGGPDNAVGYLGAIIGAVLVLLVYKLVTRGSHRTV
jgi:uncharacterized membrane protein YeaQ/YmgE (transglycosylase-associated protein family)